jgi:long-chain acyl-CoA synthetase
MPKKVTLADYFAEHLSSRKVICEVETGVIKTYSQIFENALGLAAGLEIKQGERLSVILPNSSAWVEYFLASLLGGWVFSPLPYFVEIQELNKILAYVKPSAIVTDREDINEELGNEYKVLKVYQDQASHKQYKRPNIDENAAAALYYSSGTTGDPKGVIYSHKNITSLIESIIRGFKFSPEDRQFAFLPFGHTASINYNILPALMVGCDLVVSQGFERLRENFFRILAKHRITYTEIVPTVLFMLNKLRMNNQGLDLSNLQFIGCGSSTLPLTSQIEFIETYGIKVANLYGLSETGPSHIDDPRESDWAPGSIGYPLEVNECKIAEDGEILLKGDNIFTGYYQNKSLYKEVIKEGWFHTGDLGEKKNGKFYFTDRKKDLIIKGGINIVPMEVEEAIYCHPQVAECVVVGKFSKLHGEEIVAVVVKVVDAGDETQLAKEIKGFCKQKLSSYKIPSKVFFWESLPKTASKKLIRHKVREKINI